MLLCRDNSPGEGPRDDVEACSLPMHDPLASVAGWRMEELPETVDGKTATGNAREYVSSGDVVSNAPELARLTLNLARVHQDERNGGRRLVYGGHTIGLAFAQACRNLPGLIVPLGWESCDHVAPVLEGDTVHTRHAVLGTAPGPEGTTVQSIQTTAFTQQSLRAVPNQVLNWRWAALVRCRAKVAVRTPM